MAKAKITTFAQVLRLLGSLNDSEKATLRDVLRPAPAPRKKAVKKARPEASATPLLDAGQGGEKDQSANKPELCTACGNTEDYQDHFKPSPHYHPFGSPSSAKSATKRSSSKNARTMESGAST